MRQKKSFKGDLNPAMQFITMPDGAGGVSETQPERAPDGYKLNPRYEEKYIEKKSRRLQLLMQPSLFDKVKAKASENRISVNDFIHRLLEKELS